MLSQRFTDAADHVAVGCEVKAFERHL